MRRSLLTVLVVTAVVGASGGAVVARDLDGTGAPGPGGVDRTVASDVANPSADDSSTPFGATPSQDDRADEVLWATSDEIHDGDTIIDLDRDLNTDRDGDFTVDKAPVILQRAASGWVVNIGGGTDPLSTTEVFTIAPDGKARSVARVRGVGDVSPDGTRYVAQDRDGDGYAVWDLDSGDRVATVPTGRAAGQRPVGRAQFVDADSLATDWAKGTTHEVVLSDVGSDDRTLLADDLFGPWVVSPDGRWLAGTLGVVEDGTEVAGCVVVRPMDGHDEGRTDCGGEFIPSAGAEPKPTFASDSSAVLTAEKGYGILGGSEVGNPHFRPVPTGDNPVPAQIESPEAGFAAIYLAPGRVAVIGSKTLDEFEETRVNLCEAATGCRVVGSSTDDSFFSVLGTAY